MISRRLGHWHAWCRTCSAINHCAFRLDTYTMAASGVALPGTSGAVIGCCERVVPVRVLTVAATVCRDRTRAVQAADDSESASASEDDDDDSD